MAIDFKQMDDIYKKSITTCWDLQAQVTVVKNELRLLAEDDAGIDVKLDAVDSEAIELSNHIDALQRAVSQLSAARLSLDQMIKTYEANIEYANGVLETANIMTEAYEDKVE